MKENDALVGALVGALKVMGFFLLIAALLPAALILRRIDPKHPFRIPRLFHRLLLKLMGISLHVHGKPSMVSPVLYAVNHTSYLDVIVLGSLLPAGFVAKAEVADWPLFGLFSKIQNSVFIERKTTRAAEHLSQLQDYLSNGRNLVLFPEGTSTEGLALQKQPVQHCRRIHGRKNSRRAARFPHVHGHRRISDASRRTGAIRMVWRHGSGSPFMGRLSAQLLRRRCRVPSAYDHGGLPQPEGSGGRLSGSRRPRRQAILGAARGGSVIFLRLRCRRS
jgi:1-acyl-sn-glycerol-3-phosphate acyltransferase